MTDEQLREYLPSYGDRLAVMGFCRRKGEESRVRKSKLFERLRGKIARNRGDPVSQSGPKPSTSNAEKSKRKVELGWLHFREEGFVQVRTKKGGGTRKINVQKDTKKQDLIDEAVGLFFPNGKNVMGSISDFDVDLTDFQQHSLEAGTTVGEMYDLTRLTTLRFYLTTKKKAVVENSVSTVQGREEINGDVADVHSESLPVNTLMVNSTDAIHSESSTSTVFSTENNEVVTPLYTVYLPQDFILPEPERAQNVDTLDDSGIITFHTDTLSGIEHTDNLDDTLPLNPIQLSDFTLPPSTDMSQGEVSHTESVPKIIALHRGQIMRELIQVFCEPNVMDDNMRFQIILPNGNLEMAVDDGGVCRDVLTEFWNDFYEQCTVGKDFKVPYLRHDFGEAEWASVGRIICFGWQKVKYLPVKIAPVTLEQAVFGSVESDLMDTFMKYVSEPDRMIFESCCSDFESADMDELMDAMAIHHCRRVPTADNIKQILLELAHQKLIQEPAFVIDQWNNILTPIKSELRGIAALYQDLQPTSRKIIRSIAYPESQNAQEKQIVTYVNAYLRESDKQHLSSFLRFCTGSDLCLGKTITVSFTQVQGFQRRPVSHTCGCYLELSVFYDSYPEFKYEMNKVLENNIWIMDIA